jgi:hypothetical protein
LDEFDGSEVWQNMDGTWWTRFPPPADFQGIEEGEPGRQRYRRTLSEQNPPLARVTLPMKKKVTVPVPRAHLLHRINIRQPRRTGLQAPP